jgi:hypothetical protein
VIDLRMKEIFFDTKKVRSAVDRTTRRVLSRFGAFVRRTARSSIRKRKKTSAPGQPPSSHTGLLKRFIWFGYEPSKRSVVIGPARLTQGGRGEAPENLEYGGMATVIRQKRNRRARIRPRPFMRPAFEKEQQQLPALWANSIK